MINCFRLGLLHLVGGLSLLVGGHSVAVLGECDAGFCPLLGDALLGDGGPCSLLCVDIHGWSKMLV